MGTRAARIVRIVRLVRLIRIVKLYKAALTTLVAKQARLYEEGLSKSGGGSFAVNSEDIMKAGDLGSGPRHGRESGELSHRLHSESAEPKESRSRKQSKDSFEMRQSIKSGSLENLDEKKSVSGDKEKEKNNTSEIEVSKFVYNNEY